MILARSERFVSSSNSGLSCRRRMASRAIPMSAFANIWPINCRSSANARCNLLARPGVLCCSRSSAARIAPSNSGVISSLQRSRSVADIGIARDAMRRLQLSPLFDELTKRSLLARIIKIHPGLESMVTGGQHLQNFPLFCRGQFRQDRRQTLLFLEN